MFLELMPLLGAATLSITVVKEDEATIRLTISSRYTEGTPIANLRPLSVVGTPEELEEGLADALAEHVAVRLSIAEQVAEQTRQMQEQAKVKTTPPAATAAAATTTTTRKKSGRPAATPAVDKTASVTTAERDEDEGDGTLPMDLSAALPPSAEGPRRVVTADEDDDLLGGF